MRSKSAKIEIDWSELSADEEDDIIRVIEKHYDYINECIDKVFNGEKVDILRITKKIQYIMCRFKDTTLGIKKLDFNEK